MATKKQTEYLARGWHLVYNQGASRKFYQVIIVETGLCVLRWGRIGTAGQSTVTTHATESDALDVALRQVYAKKAKGYNQIHGDLHFMADENVVEWARQQHNVARLGDLFNKAHTENLFTGMKEVVLKHYEEFSERTKTLMDQAADADLDTSLEQLTQLEEVWAEISKHHAEVEIAMGMAKQTLAQKLMAGL